MPSARRHGKGWQAIARYADPGQDRATNHYGQSGYSKEEAVKAAQRIEILVSAGVPPEAKSKRASIHTWEGIRDLA